MITIATFDNPEQAELLKSHLEQAGIEAFVANASIVSLNWSYTNLVGGIKVQVHENDYQRAESFLRHSENSPMEGKEPLSEYKCPNCDSTKVEYRRISKAFFMFSLLLLSIPLALYHPRFKCLECGTTWKKDDPAKR